MCDPELTRQVRLDDRTYDKGGPIFDRTREVVGDSLGTCPYSRHRRQRRLTQPAFHPTDIIAYRTIESGDHGDLLSALLSSRDPEGLGRDAAVGEQETLTDAELSDQVIFFLAAGTETTASVLAWALHLLGQHPEIQQRVQIEIDTILAGGAARFDHLSELKMTGRVITETLRLYPPGWFITRTVATASRLGGHDLAAGTTIAYSPYLIQHRPDLYESPEQFNPDRWDATRYPPPPRNGAIPFAAGARKCIGDQFAITEATLRPGCHHGALEPATPALPGTTHHRCRAEPTETTDAPCCPYKAS